MGVYLDKANQYIEDILSGRIIACDEVKWACLRQKRDLARQNTDGFSYVFDERRAELPCKFIEKFKHVKGIWKGQQFRLEPFQCFIVTTIFGWHDVANNRRRFNSCYCELPRKQGKSILAGGIALYCLMVDDLEPTPEIYIAATTLEQAGEVFEPCKEMIDSAPEIKRLFKVKTYSRSIVCGRTGGRIKQVIGKDKDGKSPSLFVLDEYHQAPNSKLLNSFTTGLGARRSGFGFIITTAGNDLTSPCKEMHDHIEQVLTGADPEERDFGIIYTLPQGYDWKDYNNWKYANPNYGISVDEEFLQKQFRTATTRPSEQNDILTKNLNVWCTVDKSWMNMMKLAGCVEADIKPEMFKGKNCVVGLDLAEKLDLTAAVLCFYDETDVYVFPRFYMPEEAVAKATHDRFRNFVAKGLLKVCPGDVMDLRIVKEDLDFWRQEFGADTICYDPWHAVYFIQQLQSEAYNCIEVKPSVSIMSEAMKQCEADIYSRHFHYDGNSVLTWNFSNVVGHYDLKGNIYPRKDKRGDKIDGAMATFTAYDSIMRERSRMADGAVGMIFF